jgi:hypothetical protein
MVEKMPRSPRSPRRWGILEVQGVSRAKVIDMIFFVEGER